MTSIGNSSSSKSIILQVIVICLVFLGLYLLRWNTLQNLEAQGKSLGFGFISDTAGFAILPTLGTWLMDYQVGSSTYLDVFFVGVINTLGVAIIGIIAATIVGFLIGIARLSDNFILKWFSAIYVEIFRNIPLLLWLFIVYFAVLRNLPNKRSAAFIIDDWLGVNITGFYAPAPYAQEGFGLFFLIVVLFLILTYLLARWNKNRFLATGKRLPIFWISVAIMGFSTLVGFYLTGKPINLDYPVFKSEGPILRRGYQSDHGMMIVPEMIAIWSALSLYTSAFIAEIVRSGILAIDSGQSEASSALGLRRLTTLRLVIIPQALRVIVPPLTSQYLNLTKNSSLSVAIAYPELVSTFGGTTLNNVGKELEIIFMLMLVYLTFSLITSGFMNWFNSRIKLTER